MEVEIRLDPERQQPRLVIYAAEETDELRELARQLEQLSLGPVQLWREERACSVRQGDLLRFYTEGKGVCAQTRDGIYTVRLRLYELEEQLDPLRFVRISNSEIVNLDAVTAVDLSLSGTICMTLEGEIRCYVSRRYVKKIKQVLNLKRRDGK